jgi:pyruvate formate lyase activating enzyme
MKLIGMEKGGGAARIDFYGCPLKCEYCTHEDQEKTDHDIMEVLEFLADPEVEQVYIGGAEPTLQGKEVIELLERLKRMKKRAILKINGYYPDVIERTIGLVHQYMLEIKCPLDDRECNQALSGLDQERAGRYTENLSKTLDILKDQRVRVWIRVIPGFLDEERMESIGKDIEGVAEEAWLLQFLSNTENDAPFRDIDEPGPSEAEIVSMGRRLVKYVPNVTIMGEGFSSEFKVN